MTEKELILTDILGCSREKLYCNKNISQRANSKLEAILEKRKKGIPLQYLLGKTNFFGFEFKLDERALIPRFETEILVEKTIKIIKSLKLKKFNLLDLCTGSGCIAISIAKFFEYAKIVASDISAGSLDLAKENALVNRVSKRVKFIRSNLFQKIGNERYNIITSNPPYISTKELKNLAPEIDYEPRSALDGGEDGISFYRRILKDVHLYLEDEGLFIFEIGFNQTESIIELIDKNSQLELVEIIKDYNKFDRVGIVKNG